MTQPVIASRFSTHRPSGALSRHISQYWLSLDNSAPIYTALPDGCVDLVFEVADGDCHARVYGSTTRPTDIGLIDPAGTCVDVVQQIEPAAGFWDPYLR